MNWVVVGVVITYNLILDFKAKFFKRFHCNVGINSVWGINKAVCTWH